MNPAVSIDDAEAQLEQLSLHLNSIQRSMRLAIEAHLRAMAGTSFGSLDANQQFARSVQELLESHGLRVRCVECGHPAILRCSRSAGSPHGVFVFDHYIGRKRTFHGGGSSLPPVRVIAKPARRSALPAR